MRDAGRNKHRCKRVPCASTQDPSTRVLILLGTRPNISESHSEISTRVPFCIALAGAARTPVSRLPLRVCLLRVPGRRRVPPARPSPPPYFVPGSPHVHPDRAATRPSHCVPGSPHVCCSLSQPAVPSLPAARPCHGVAPPVRARGGARARGQHRAAQRDLV